MPDRAGKTSCKLKRPKEWDVQTPHRIRKESRASPSPLPVPQIGLWRLLTVTSTVVILFALYRQGLPRAGWDWWPGSWLVPALHGLAGVISGGEAVGLWKRLGFLALAIFCFIAARSWQKARLAYLPGSVDVHPFTDANPGQEAPVAELKDQFCRQLSDTQIYPPYAGPADPPAVSFLDVFQKSDANATNPFMMALQWIAKLWPRTGYYVTGTLLTRSPEPRYGVSATVSSFADGSRSAMTTQWGKSWEDANCKAAYWILATILPSTRLTKTPPWRRWRGRQLPYELFKAYNEGKQAQDNGRLDEALRWYTEALERDPFNADLRLMVASAQEELGLFLDALDTYQGALTVGELSERYTGHIWSRKRDRLRHPVRDIVGPLRYLRRRRDSISLRYQYASTLAYSERTVHDWFAEDAVEERERVRNQIKDRLRKALIERYWPVVMAFADPPKEEAAKEWLSGVLDDSQNPEAVKVVFQLAAAQELYRLHEDLVLAWFIPGTRTKFTRGVLRLARDVWAPLRLARALHDWREQGWRPARLEETEGIPTPPFDRAGCLSPWWLWWRRNRASAIMQTWPPPVRQLEKAIRRAQRWRISWPHLSYLDHYGAACTYAFALYGHLPDPNPGPEVTPAADLATSPAERRNADVVVMRRGSGCARQPESDEVGQLTEKAVERLQASLACTESGVAARLRNWISSSDPDLGRLRQQPEFRRFERDQYPRLRLVLPRPDKVTTAQTAAYAKQLICQSARLLEREWHHRGRPSEDVDIHQLIDWLDLDARTWVTLKRIAADRAWHWRDRAEFIQLVREAVDLASAGSAKFPPAVPCFDDVVMPGSAELASDDSRSGAQIEHLVGCHVEQFENTLRTMRVRVAEQGACASRLSQAQVARMDLRGEPLQESHVREVCSSRAGSWQRVVRHLAKARIEVDPIDPKDVQLRA